MSDTTLSSYLAVSRNLTRYQKMVASDPMVKTPGDYYAANIGKVKSIADFVGNYRLLSYALKAYGLSDHINDKALVTKVLQGGVSSSKALANTLADPRWQAFAKAFDFVGKGAPSVGVSSAVDKVKSGYVENELEIGQGNQNVGVQLALYFKRVASTITSVYSIIGDKNLLQVAQTIFNIPAMTGSDVDQQAKIIGKLMPIASLQDPAKLEKLTERFSAMYDITYGASGGGLTAVGYGASQANAATGVLQGIITSNGQTLAKALSSSTPTSLFSDQFMAQLQRLSIGGV